MRTLALATLMAFAPLAQALDCGALIERDVRLDRDLFCHGDAPALRVAGSGISIDFNGYRLRGDGRGTGILVQDAADVSLLGAGSVEGFGVGIEALRSPRLRVKGLELTRLDSGLLLHNSYAAEVRDNRFKALPWSEYNIEGGHRIVDNRIERAGFGLHLCGYDSGGSLLQGNRLSDISQIALLIEDGADDNRIVDNRIERSLVASVALRGSSGNALLDNQLLDSRVGISLQPIAGPGCVARGPVDVAGNRIEDNLLSGHDRAFAIAYTAQRGGTGHNRIRNNTVIPAQGQEPGSSAVVEPRLVAYRPGR